MLQTILLIFEIIGTVAFAVSGALIAISKKMDIFGVVILGLVTAVGGGVTRDLVLGNTPPETFKNPLYGIIAITVSVIVFIPFVRNRLVKNQRISDLILLIMDSLGLAVFTVVGIETAAALLDGFNVYLLLFVGVVTGVGGGVLRDVLSGNTPYIFVKHFYATASLIGSAVTIGLWNFAGAVYSMIAGAAVIFALRMCAAHFHWKLPRA